MTSRLPVNSTRSLWRLPGCYHRGGRNASQLSVHGRDVVRGFAEDEIIKAGRGQNLLPWPNRIRDGRYLFDGQSTTDSERTAPQQRDHGLARPVPWVLIDRTPDSVTNRVRIHPQPGWPGPLEAMITHRVGEDGLTITVEATNLSPGDLPFGYAAHPYLTVGEWRSMRSRCVPAASYLEVDDRLLPIRISSVAGTVYDLRAGMPLGSVIWTPR